MEISEPERLLLKAKVDPVMPGPDSASLLALAEKLDPKSPDQPAFSPRTRADPKSVT